MKRLITVLALAVACNLGMSAAYAGIGCCSKKDTQAQSAKTSKSACCTAKKVASADKAFPTMVQLVGDKAVACSVAAKKMAEETGQKIVYVVAGKNYSCKVAAMSAMADAAENYVKKFTTIACVVDGKVIYCGEKGAGSACCNKTAKASATCGNKSLLAKASAKSSCCKNAQAKQVKLAKAGGKCCKGAQAKQAKLAKADGNSCTKTCPHAAITAKMAKAGGKCCKGAQAKQAKLAKADGNSCTKTCPHAATAAKMVKADGKSCTKTCPLSAAAAKLAKAGGKCCKGASAKQAKLAKADGKSCCKSAQAKMAKADAASGYHAGFAAGYSAGYSAGFEAKLTKAHGDVWSKQGKTVTFRVAGRDFDNWPDAVQARDRALAAVKQVNMTYLVGGKELTCASQVCPKAKAAGKVKYVVGGKKMECQYCARTALAKARLAAIQNVSTKRVAQK